MTKLPADIEATVREFANLVEADGIPIHDVRVFGSRARGTARPDSDIDVCVISSAFGTDSVEETGRLLRIAARQSRLYPLEPVALSPDDLDDEWSTLAAEIRRDGIPIQL